MRRSILAITAALVAVASLTPFASGNDKYEVWAIDQSNSPGKSFGGTLYIWDGHALENRHRAASAPATKIDLSRDAAALCLARTGANPVRPHMMAINPAQTHAIISFVASGHVLFMDAKARRRLPVSGPRRATQASARRTCPHHPRTGPT